jgi:hypothetical protein
MNSVFLSIVFFVYGVAIYQLGLAFNLNVISSSGLTILGMAAGLLIGVLYFFIRKKAADKNFGAFFDYDRLPWYEKMPNYPRTYFLSILVGMVLLSLLNNVPQSSITHTELFKVEGTKKFRVRYSHLNYVHLCNSRRCLKYSPNDEEHFKDGQQVTVIFFRGFIGFKKIEAVA